MGLEVTDDELRKKIEETALFQEGGRFDPVKYRQLLSSSRVALAAYEESQRMEMLAGKVRTIVQDAAQVTEAEAFESYRKDKEKIRLDLLALPFENYKGWVSVDEDEVADHYENNAETYRRPERLKASYVVITAESLAESIEAAEEELLAYYEENSETWKTPHRVKARHVLIKAEAADDDARRAELRERADFVLEKARERR